MKKQMHALVSIVLPFATLIFANTALAFHLPDHVAITKQALEEFNNCYPGMLRDDEPFFLISSNVDEDINLIRKDLAYSHFYSPNKVLDMFRHDSSVRIQRISQGLKTEKNSTQAFIALGHAFHHIQDMASPAHSVPVFHGPSDPFETFKVQNQAFATGLSCAQLETLAGENPDLPGLLKKAALESLQAVSSIALPIQRFNADGTRETYSVNGESFWKVTAGNDFGVYGPLGRHFGEAQVQFKDAKVVLPMAFFETFKNKQMQMAVLNSWIALYNFHQPKSSDAAHRFNAKDVNPFSVLQMETYRRLANLFYF